jgi:hypothetical protein
MTSSPQAASVRVATLNTWGTRGDWPRRQRILRNGLDDLNADLVTLQETIVAGDYDQAADVLLDEYHLVHSQAREADGQGITTASRWPVGETIELDLNVTGRTGDFACTSLITEVLAPAPLDRIWLVNHSPTTSWTTSTSANCRRWRRPGFWRIRPPPASGSGPGATRWTV